MRNLTAVKVVIIDNYDSFTYNLEQYLGGLGAETVTLRNDAMIAPEIERYEPDAIVISPGPGVPDTAGISLDVIRHFHGRLPLLGVCLGHQAIGQAFGGEVISAPKIRHGKTSLVRHEGDGIFVELEKPMTATRYHSLIVRRETLPEELRVTAWTDDGLVMGLQVHGEHTYGVQFHPESYATRMGIKLMENFLCCQN